MCDVKQWPRWDVGLQESFLHYPGQGIHDGAQGTLIMKENRGTFVFTLCDLNATKGFFAYQTELKGANAVWFWDFTQNGATDKEFILDMGVTFTGWLAPAYKVYLEKECHEAFEKCAVLLKGLVEGSGLSETKK